jgi:hypothetical protein
VTHHDAHAAYKIVCAFADSLFDDSDGAQHAPGDAMLGAVGEVASVARCTAGAGRTFSDNGDARWINSRFQKLAAVRLPEIDEVLPSTIG